MTTTAAEGMTPTPEVKYAGFWKRLLAFVVDLAITSLIFFALAVILPILLGPRLGVPSGGVILACGHCHMAGCHLVVLGTDGEQLQAGHCGQGSPGHRGHRWRGKPDILRQGDLEVLRQDSLGAAGTGGFLHDRLHGQEAGPARPDQWKPRGDEAVAGHTPGFDIQLPAFWRNLRPYKNTSPT